jgi:hypothetical protein
MPTPEQTNTAQEKLEPQPYDAATSKLSANAVQDLFVHLRQFLYDTRRSGGYKQLRGKLAAAVGRPAAQLQAVLDNVSGVGSKVAKLTGEVEYSTEDTKRSELEFALFVLYEPVPTTTLGTQASDMADRIRGQYSCGGCGRRGCSNCFDEYRLTISNC